ncbi:MAG: hypothetical protein JXQ73_04500 [Phycisphaerae bacterium]|nr:hypothetical protein [Phycisphaerae bacterium]
MTIRPLSLRFTATLIVVASYLLCVHGPGLSMAEEPEYPRIDAAVGYEVDASWPKRPKEVTWGACTGVTVDADDNVYVYTRGTPPVQVYAPDGRYVRGWGQEVLKSAHFIHIDPKGNVWVPDLDTHTIRKFTPEGKLLLTIGTEGESGCDEKHFWLPTDIAVSPAGDVFVADGYGNSRIVHFDGEGKFVKAWGKLGVGPGEFSIVHAIELDSKGRIYECDRNTARVQVFTQDGKLLCEWRNLLVPWGIHITPKDEIWICGSSPMRWGKEGGFGGPPKDQLIMRFDRQGKAQQLWTMPICPEDKPQPGAFNVLHGIAVDSKGNVYLGDVNGKRVQKFVRLPAGRP